LLMSRDALLLPRFPVRANYRPDMHLGRPPVLPVVSPKAA
jgi:hypothetical protein